MSRTRSSKPLQAHKRPRILVNVAMTVDGKIDTTARTGALLSSAADKQRVDRLRADVDAVMVGGNTLLQEDPRLTVRSEELRLGRRKLGKPDNPVKVGVVSCIGEEDLPASGHFLSAGPAGVILFTTPQTDPGTIRRLEEAGARLHVSGSARVDLPLALDLLHSQGIRTLLVEGGGTLLAELFRLGAVDELTVYIAPRILGGAGAPTLSDGAGFAEADAPRCRLIQVATLDDEGGVVLQYQVLHKE
jgi:2,5-diamino-6-(ribosylamino)-4(3H)-pyrimidinone 5'-phosphate reductase